MSSAPIRSFPISRRRALSLAAGATAMVATAGLVQRSAAQDASPAPEPATTPVTISLPSLPVGMAADASPEFQVVVEALAAAMTQHHVPGAAIGLLAGDREEHATIGVASLSSLQPITSDTLFQIGSVSKTYTATAIWRLIDEGVLDFDAPVRSYLPDLKLLDETVAAEVTVANLLDHSAGWYGDEGVNIGDDDDAISRYVNERLPQLPQVYPLGDYFSYNNAAFTLLGRLLEVATGTVYNAAMDHMLLGPLGLEDSLLDRGAVLQRPYADGHMATLINGRPSLAVQTPLWIPRSTDPAGGIWATTRDVVRYGRFHLNTDTANGAANIVSLDSLRHMREPAMPILGTPLHMGRDWFVQDVAGERVIFHGGDTLGQHADLFLIPGQEFALVVLTNAQGGGSAATAAALNAALDQFPALAPLSGQIGLVESLSLPAGTPELTPSAKDVAAIVGRYADPGQSLTITEVDSGLTMTLETLDQPDGYVGTINSPPAPLLPVTFVDEDVATFGGQRLPLIRDANGMIDWVSLGLRLVPRVRDA